MFHRGRYTDGALFLKPAWGINLFELNTIGFPLFVKTLHEGTSKGITQNSRVENFEQLKAQVVHICRNYKQPALVEEFIKGTEFTVGVIGNEAGVSHAGGAVCDCGQDRFRQ